MICLVFGKRRVKWLSELQEYKRARTYRESRERDRGVLKSAPVLCSLHKRSNGFFFFFFFFFSFTTYASFLPSDTFGLLARVDGPAKDAHKVILLVQHHCTKRRPGLDSACCLCLEGYSVRRRNGSPRPFREINDRALEEEEKKPAEKSISQRRIE